jgi:hypothetical protein
MPRALLPIIALIASSAGASAQTTPSPIIGYATVGGWQIYVDMEHGHSCHIVGSYASGTMVSFGVDRRPGDQAGYLIVANPAWKGFDDGRTYPIVAQYAGAKPWKGMAKASVVEGTPALTLRFADPTFARQFAGSKALTIVHAGKRLAELDLASSGVAVKAMIACQGEVDGLLARMEAEEDGDAQEASGADLTQS